MEVDGKVAAIGIVIGVVVGFIVFALTGNTIWIYLFAAIGLVLALGYKGKRGGGDQP